VQTFSHGNKRIDVDDHIATAVRTVDTDRRGGEFEVANRLVRRTSDVGDFSRRNQVDHYLLPPREWRPHYASIRDPAQQREGIVLWRGDGRAPEEMFRAGFEPRIRDLQVPVWRCVESDIYPLTAVCLSVAFESACLFPLINEGEDGRLRNDPTWIYAVALTHGAAYFNTQWVQGEIGAGRIGAAGGARELARANATAGEICVQRVDCNDILAAVRVHRDWTSTDWTRLGRVRIDSASLTINSGSSHSSLAGPIRTDLRDRMLRTTNLQRDGGDALALLDAPA
jgi:hypothetical protein